MTDKPGEPLNLIERMAKRLAAEEGAATNVAPPRKIGLVERAAEKVASLPGPFAETPSVRDEMTAQLGDKPAHASANVPAPHPGIAPANPKQVRLDFRALRQNGMITPDNMTSAISNEFRGIKRKLLQKVRDPKTRAAVNNLIMITSSLPGEGKTFSSMNLALSLAAEKGLHVLLIDADIIRPSVGNMFVSPPRVGLTELLSGKTSNVSDVLHRCVDVPNLSVIFSGSPRNGSPELISSAQMVNLCREMSSRYPDRVIVIDTPPVLASSEAAILAGYVHQVIMVVSADQADKHQLRTSLESVSACQNICLLFNKAPNWNEAEYQSYYGYADQAAPAPTPQA
ncbi:MAG: P-loop NTPase [Alphaproteobacteria bacterium]|nr:P-loop NTPase [Alphaproteobacteria bacterium]